LFALIISKARVLYHKNLIFASDFDKNKDIEKLF